MRALLAICLFASSAFVFAASPAAPIKGAVLEVKDVESYTYLRLKTQQGETWAAVNRAPIKVGAEVTIADPMLMQNFESKSLHKTFPKIIFGSLANAATNSAMNMATAHAGVAKAPVAGDIHVAKAVGANARTVAEIHLQSAKLNNKSVLLRGKVVKYNAGIMGKNWLHLRDGSGKDADGSNDILVTSTQQSKVGDVVIAQGTVHTDKDFGAGYAYKVLIEDAKLNP